MALLLGINDLKQRALPTYWDIATLEQQRLKDGSNYQELLDDIASGLAMVNAQLITESLYAGLVSPTTELAMEYRVGMSNGFQPHTEYSRPDARRGLTTGHMLPIEKYDRMMGWTWDYLNEARRAKIDADIASALDDLINLWQKEILTKLFKSTYTAIGSSGRAMPLADGGTADSVYVPMAKPERAPAFLYTHDHILAVNGITQVLLEPVVTNLWEHGYDSPFDLLISTLDVASWTDAANMSGWIPRGDPALIQYGLTADFARVDESYIGVIETDRGVCRVRMSGRIPTNYWALYKAYGPSDARNVLKVRYEDEFGIGAVLLSGDHIRDFPFENAILFSKFGVGVGEDRTAGIVVKNTAGAYTDPTIV